MNAVTLVGVALLFAAVALQLIGRSAWPVYLAGIVTVVASYALAALFRDFALDSLTSWVMVVVVVIAAVVTLRSWAWGRQAVKWVLVLGAVMGAIAAYHEWSKTPSVEKFAAPYHDDLAACPDVVFLGARGSGEDRSDALEGGTASKGSGYGGVVGPIRDALLTELEARGIRMADYPIDYPALPVYSPDRWSLVDDLARGSGEFIKGADTGAVETLDTITRLASTCGRSTRVVAVGYSQGALAIHAGVGAREQDTASQDVFVQLIADPVRLASEPEPRGYVTPGVGILVELGVITPEPLAGALSWCAQQDPVCGYADSDQGTLDAHYAPYAAPDFTRAVVEAILGQLGLA